jgi:hypothetical protein
LIGTALDQLFEKGTLSLESYIDILEQSTDPKKTAPHSRAAVLEWAARCVGTPERVKDLSLNTLLNLLIWAKRSLDETSESDPQVRSTATLVFVKLIASSEKANKKVDKMYDLVDEVKDLNPRIYPKIIEGIDQEMSGKPANGQEMGVKEVIDNIFYSVNSIYQLSLILHNFFNLKFHLRFC